MNNMLFVDQPVDRHLTTDGIHVWLVSLDQPVSQFQGLLSIDERIRAERFHFDRDRNRFIVGRGILRTITGCYLGVEPGRLQFCYGSKGKPALADTFGKGMVNFNLAHSEGLAVYAFSRGRNVGVDIEYMREISDIEQIAERVFSVRERATLRELPGSGQIEAFFNCWTRKEAFAKAIGDGLSWPLGSFDVPPVPGEPVKNLTVNDDLINGSRWFVYDFKVGGGYKAAFATEGQCYEPVYFQW
jgi:4'-phosphopantetheinyl transferase